MHSLLSIHEGWAVPTWFLEVLLPTGVTNLSAIWLLLSHLENVLPDTSVGALLFPSYPSPPAMPDPGYEEEPGH